jgi:hypothetical protein
MSEIKLDTTRLLGFKIIATGESTATLRSPKVGGKACTVVEMVAGTNTAALRAKVGTKTD